MKYEHKSNALEHIHEKITQEIDRLSRKHSCKAHIEKSYHFGNFQHRATKIENQIIFPTCFPINKSKQKFSFFPTHLTN